MNPYGRPENLKPWAKGVSGNPSGRPRRRPIAELIRSHMEATAFDDIEFRRGMTLERWIFYELLLRLRDHDFRALQELVDRSEGKVSDEPPVVTVHPMIETFRALLDATKQQHEQDKKRARA